jgi:hypothetical protein
VYIIIYGITLERKGLQQCSTNFRSTKVKGSPLHVGKMGKWRRIKAKINQKE